VSAASAVPPRLRVERLAKSYGAVRALRDVSLEVRTGEVHGLCGHNGAGKSTLVKILSGVVRPDEGTVFVDDQEVHFRNPEQAQRSGIALVDQEISLIGSLSIRENLLLGLPGAPFVARPGSSADFIENLLHRVGLDDVRPSTRVDQLPLGRRQLVEIARALGRGGRLLILDEPTATLSEGESLRVFDAVRAVAAGGISVIYVSHRLGEVLDLCDRISVFRDGTLIDTRTAADLGRAQLVELLVGMDGLRVPAAADPAPSDRALPPRLEIRGLHVPNRVESMDLTVYPGQIVALAGQVGSGASDLLRAIAGLSPEATGLVRLGGQQLTMGQPVTALHRGIRFVSNDRKHEGLFLDRTVRTNLTSTRLPSVSTFGVIRSRRLREIAHKLASSIGLSRRGQSAVGNLSGGNQQKVFIGRSLDSGVDNVLLLDEPTRGVDVAGRQDIHRLVREAAASGTAVLFASTEIEEVLDLGHDIVTMYGGRKISERPREGVTVQSLLSDMTHVQTRETQ
jgi:ABC-type sugar transport system ATPase subunit